MSNLDVPKSLVDEWVISLAREKGKRSARARMRALTVPADAVPRVIALLELWLDVRGNVRPGDSLYALSSDQRRCARGAPVQFAAMCVDGLSGCWVRVIENLKIFPSAISN